jgi:predicted NUDIX family NTP pyrophosphohydrolase
MKSNQSAGILLYRQKKGGGTEVFLGHPGGPFWKNKDAGAWTIPKGEFADDEPAFDAAVREFREETGVSLRGSFVPLTPVKQKSGKIVHAWAIAGDLDPAFLISNTFDIEWPPHTGKMQTFPEIDRTAWYTLDEARRYINPAQTALLDELEQILNAAAR